MFTNLDKLFISALFWLILLSSAFAERFELISIDMNEEAAGQVDKNNFMDHEIDMSYDGRYVVFSSSSRKIVPGDTNYAIVGSDFDGSDDIFLRDRLQQTTERVSLRADGGQIETGLSIHPSMSADGTVIAYESSASDIVAGDQDYAVIWDIYSINLITKVTELVSSPSYPDLYSWDYGNEAIVSGNGQCIIYSSGNINIYNIFTNITNIIYIINIKGDVVNKALNFDGRFIVYQACNFYDDWINLYDRETNETKVISISSKGEPANNRSMNPKISDDGRYVLFISKADNLVENDPTGGTGYYEGWDVYIHDRETGITSLVAFGEYEDKLRITFDGMKVNLSATGRYIVYPGQSGWVYRYDQETQEVRRLFYAPNSNTFYLTPDGNTIAFVTDDNGLVPEDNNNDFDVYVFELDEEASNVPEWENHE